MIPYAQQPSISLGPVTIYTFGMIVALAILIGLEFGRRRLRHLGLDPLLGQGVVWSALGVGFLGAHFFSVLFYFPAEVTDNPLVLLKVWEDISSFGGMLGGLLGIWLYLKLKAPDLEPLDRWKYLDVAVLAFTVALTVGRIACTVAHDHPGALTSFPLAVSLETPAAREYIQQVYRSAELLPDLPATAELSRLGFHDLGWYELLYLGAVVLPTMLLLGRKPRSPGFFAATFVLLYMPVRFAFDFLRVSDVRYGGLTPAQYVAVAGLVLFVYFWRKRSRPSAWVCGTRSA
jgi:phosphatidylglycerol:prolipoprotein diacylglycerol transferase